MQHPNSDCVDLYLKQFDADPQENGRKKLGAARDRTEAIREEFVLQKKLTSKKQYSAYAAYAIAQRLIQYYNRNDGRCSPSYQKIAVELGIGKARVTELLHLMQELGFLLLCPKDPSKRNFRILLDEKGDSTGPSRKAVIALNLDANKPKRVGKVTKTTSFAVDGSIRSFSFRGSGRGLPPDGKIPIIAGPSSSAHVSAFPIDNSLVICMARIILGIVKGDKTHGAVALSAAKHSINDLAELLEALSVSLPALPRSEGEAVADYDLRREIHYEAFVDSYRPSVQRAKDMAMTELNGGQPVVPPAERDANKTPSEIKAAKAAKAAQARIDAQLKEATRKIRTMLGSN